MYRSLSFIEALGISPLRERMKQAAFALRGDAYTPRSRFDLSSLSLARPRISFSAWLDISPEDRLTPIVNLFNHTPTPITEGWSVRRHQMCDFRGSTLTYDSHNGTDFAVAPGVPVVAPAPGIVVRVSNEFHRGGLKVVIDHGDNLITTSNHLGRALVREGEQVARGQRIALTGASGLDLLAVFPLMTPHVHFNTWFNGAPVDPFAREGETSIWRKHNEPIPCQRHELGALEKLKPSRVSPKLLKRAISLCRDEEMRAKLEAGTDAYQTGMELIFNQNYYPTRFEERLSPFQKTLERRPRIDLPFEEDDFVGAYFADR